MVCEKCGEFLEYGGVISTLVGYFSPPGHDHDNNCKELYLKCKNNHKKSFMVRCRCHNSNCDWVGKETCFCHEGKKIECPEEYKEKFYKVFK